MEIAHRFFDTGELRLHVAEQGEGKPVVFLHGFPEGWFSWRAQMSALAGAGFRAVAPDLRGYGESDKPRGIEHYRASLIADDVAALIRSLGQGAVPVVGHDWGAPIAFRLAMDHPVLVSRLFVMNGPHPLQFSRLLRRSWSQRRRSWYMAFFQLPHVPERLLSRPGTMGRMLRGATSAPELEEYERAFSTPDAFHAPINWYRAAARVRDRKPKAPVFDKDCRMIWGMRDFALTPRCLDGLEEWLPRVKIERLPNAGHFVQHEARDDVSAILLRDLRE